jgi:hypothetical protein
MDRRYAMPEAGTSHQRSSQEPRKFSAAALEQQDARGSMYDVIILGMGVGMFVAFLLYAGLCEKM